VCHTLLRRDPQDAYAVTYVVDIYALLTVHPREIFVNNQFDVHIFHVRLFVFSTCFGQPCAHHQENYCINAITGICHYV